MKNMDMGMIKDSNLNNAENVLVDLDFAEIESGFKVAKPLYDWAVAILSAKGRGPNH